MGCMGEHINGLHHSNTVLGVHHLEIACLGGGVTADVDNTQGIGTQNGCYNIGVHTCPGRVCDDDVRTSVLFNEGIAEHILHVAGKEAGVGDAVKLGVDLGILNGLGHIFYADDLGRLSGYEVGNGACAGVEVVDVSLPVSPARSRATL